MSFRRTLCHTQLYKGSGNTFPTILCVYVSFSDPTVVGRVNVLLMVMLLRGPWVSSLCRSLHWAPGAPDRCRTQSVLKATVTWAKLHTQTEVLFSKYLHTTAGTPERVSLCQRIMVPALLRSTVTKEIFIHSRVFFCGYSQGLFSSINVWSACDRMHASCSFCFLMSQIITNLWANGHFFSEACDVSCWKI